MSDRGSGEVVLAFLLGALIGAAAGILFAPKSGKETRKKLKDLTEDWNDKLADIKDEIVDKAKDFIEESKEKIEDQKERIEAAIHAGKKAYDHKPK